MALIEGSILVATLGAGWLWARQRERNLSRQLAEAQRALEESREANEALGNLLNGLQEVAGTDRLTGCWNRRRFEESAHSLISLCRRKRAPFSLIMFDLDRFKRVNDEHGHLTGDQVLQEVAAQCTTHLRDSDALARWGGEEFVIVAPMTPFQGAMALAEKVRQAMEEHNFPVIGRQTLSLGVAELAQGESFEALLMRADEALYEAKSKGRNRVIGSVAPKQSPTSRTASPLALAWDERYASGDPTIDSQHQMLFEVANELLAALSERRPAEEVQSRMHHLLGHVEQHFHDEVEILRRVGFPEAEAHAQEHARLLQRAHELAAIPGGPGAPELLGFLCLELVQAHIVETDPEFFASLRM